MTLNMALTLLTLMVTVSDNPNPTNPTTKYRCELDMRCLTWYKNLGPPFTGLPTFLPTLYIPCKNVKRL